MLPTEAIEAIIIKAHPFEEHAYILTLFSKEKGRVSCVAKGKKGKGHTGFSPLLRVEADVVVSEKELWKCPRLEITNSFPHIRLNFETLCQAVRITEFLSYTLPLQHPTPELYTHFQQFLTHISQFRSPHVAAVIFLAKYCANEGLLGHALPLSRDDAMLCMNLAEKPFEEQYAVDCEKGLLGKLMHIAKGGT